MFSKLAVMKSRETKSMSRAAISNTHLDINKKLHSCYREERRRNSLAKFHDRVLLNLIEVKLCLSFILYIF